MAIHIDFMGNEVLWDIAKDSKGNIVRINEVSQGPYVCLECNHEMFPVRGEIKQHHLLEATEFCYTKQSRKICFRTICLWQHLFYQRNLSRLL